MPVPRITGVKFYALADGRRPGFYSSWPEASKYKGSNYKSFKELNEGFDYMKSKADISKKRVKMYGMEDYEERLEEEENEGVGSRAPSRSSTYGTNHRPYIINALAKLLREISSYEMTSIEIQECKEMCNKLCKKLDKKEPKPSIVSSESESDKSPDSNSDDYNVTYKGSKRYSTDNTRSSLNKKTTKKKKSSDNSESDNEDTHKSSKSKSKRSKDSSNELSSSKTKKDRIYGLVESESDSD